MEKSVKEYAKEAKKRLKSRFWQEYKSQINEEVNSVDESLNASKIKEYYKDKITVTIQGVDKKNEEFYEKVKYILSTFGEVSDILGRLTDKEYFSTLNYEQRQKYSFELADKYRKAKERYYKELEYEKTV